jgi:hypothetical protein
LLYLQLGSGIVVGDELSSLGILAWSIGFNDLALIAHDEEIIASATLGSDNAIVRQIMPFSGGAAAVGATNALDLDGNRFLCELRHN